jgi:FAD/FMN-containing dehydrogenase
MSVPRFRSARWGRLCENLLGALRRRSGRTGKYLILLTVVTARGEALEP